MSSMCNGFQSEMANCRWFVSLTPGFSRVRLVGQPIETVSTVSLVIQKTVKTVLNLPVRINTPLKQGVNQKSGAVHSPAERKEEVDA